MTECYHYTIRLLFCDSGGDRTHDSKIKSFVLYLLSYEVNYWVENGIRTRKAISNT